ncbi:MAG: acyl--CoA ligase [Hyphomicrobiales bacterium]|nr:acyl--CoA ligase [Hyphomicrobiales bacterium]
MSLRQHVAGAAHGAQLFAAAGRIDLGTAAHSSWLTGADAGPDATVLLRTRDQHDFALALLELDGRAGRLIICPPDLTAAQAAAVMAQHGVTHVFDDATMEGLTPVDGVRRLALRALPQQADVTAPACDTQWLMFTSGTSGPPKLVAHSFAGLTGAITPLAGADAVVWGTFYDVRRYGGLQMLLRALTGGGSMVLSQTGEPVAAFIARLREAGVTHLAGTPSHWRQALMCPDLTTLKPRYLRLSGEIVDQSVLDALRGAFPGVMIGHAFASTEAGVAFEVNDGLAGFPAAWLDMPGKVEMRVRHGTLHLRSGRTASAYAGGGGALHDDDGFVDTGDLVQQRGDRVYFAGRASGIINVGGAKVAPEEVEAVINGVAQVHQSRVHARRNPMTGSLVAAEIVALPGCDEAALRAEILQACRAALPAYKVPVSLTFVAALPMSAGGKLERRHA